jgi:hypothetical protein
VASSVIVIGYCHCIRQLREVKGIPILIGALKLLLKDDIATRMGVSIIEMCKRVQFAIMDVIVYGGLEWLNKVRTVV